MMAGWEPEGPYSHPQRELLIHQGWVRGIRKDLILMMLRNHGNCFHSGQQVCLCGFLRTSQLYAMSPSSQHSTDTCLSEHPWRLSRGGLRGDQNKGTTSHCASQREMGCSRASPPSQTQEGSLSSEPLIHCWRGCKIMQPL